MITDLVQPLLGMAHWLGQRDLRLLAPEPDAVCIQGCRQGLCGTSPPGNTQLERSKRFG